MNNLFIINKDNLKNFIYYYEHKTKNNKLTDITNSNPLYQYNKSKFNLDEHKKYIDDDFVILSNINNILIDYCEKNSIKSISFDEIILNNLKISFVNNDALLYSNSNISMGFYSGIYIMFKNGIFRDNIFKICDFGFNKINVKISTDKSAKINKYFKNEHFIQFIKLCKGISSPFISNIKKYIIKSFSNSDDNNINKDNNDYTKSMIKKNIKFIISHFFEIDDIFQKTKKYMFQIKIYSSLLKILFIDKINNKLYYISVIGNNKLNIYYYSFEINSKCDILKYPNADKLFVKNNTNINEIFSNSENNSKNNSENNSENVIVITKILQ